MRNLGLHRLVAICAIGLACQTPGGEADRISIAIVPFGVARGSSPPPVDLAEVIRSDLASRGRFAPLAPTDLPSQPTRMADVRFDDWRRIEADYLVVGRVALVHDGGHEVQFHLIDTRTQAALVEFLIQSGPDQLRLTAHEIARMIDERVGGEATRAGPKPSRSA